MSVACVVPWKPGCEHRERAWAFLKPRYGCPVTEALGGEPWVKAEAVNPAVEASSADIVVVADADVWVDELDEAVERVRAGAPWATPHGRVFRLSERGTANYMAGEPWDQQELDQRPYKGLAGGGVIVAHREVLSSVPMDPRFVGWGGEDESWGRALSCLVGPPWRGQGHLVHLWHPPQARESRRFGSQDGWRLTRRYMTARHDPRQMGTLIEEARQFDRAAHQQGMPDRPAVSVG